MRLGLALGSGGARGWAHLGVLLALRDMGIRPDVVAGTSMGALIGAVWAADCLDEMEVWARAQTRSDILRYMDFSFSGGGLMSGNVVMRVLKDLGVPDTFEALKYPLIVVATDMASGREVWLQKGSVHDAVRGSVSIPGVLSPFWHDGKWLLDGGLTNPVPTSACRALGADVTIAVNPNAKPENALWTQPRWARVSGNNCRKTAFWRGWSRRCRTCCRTTRPHPEHGACRRTMPRWSRSLSTS